MSNKAWIRDVVIGLFKGLREALSPSWPLNKAEEVIEPIPTIQEARLTAIQSIQTQRSSRSWPSDPDFAPIVPDIREIMAKASDRPIEEKPKGKGNIAPKRIEPARNFYKR